MPWLKKEHGDIYVSDRFLKEGFLIGNPSEFEEIDNTRSY